jgi:hypothetical protein
MHVHEDRTGPTAAQLDDADLARCPGCERCVDAAEVEDTGVCADCQRPETQTQHEIEREAGGY